MRKQLKCHQTSICGFSISWPLSVCHPHSLLRKATCQTIDGFICTPTALSLMRLCPSYLGVESQGRILTALGCVTDHLCVCQRSHPLDLYHQSRGRSISPKGGYTIKNRREILGKKNNRSLADHCFAPQHTDPPTPSHTHFHFQSFPSYIMQHSTYSCKHLHAFPGSLTTCWDSTEFLMSWLCPFTHIRSR